MAWSDFLHKCEYIGIQNILRTRIFQSCPLGVFLRLLTDFGDLSPTLVWKRLCLLLAGDVESNPGPMSFQSVHCSSSSPEQFPYTDKNVSSFPIAPTIYLCHAFC